MEVRGINPIKFDPVSKTTGASGIRRTQAPGVNKPMEVPGGKSTTVKSVPKVVIPKGIEKPSSSLSVEERSLIDSLFPAEAPAITKGPFKAYQVQTKNDAAKEQKKSQKFLGNYVNLLA